MCNGRMIPLGHVQHASVSHPALSPCKSSGTNSARIQAVSPSRAAGHNRCAMYYAISHRRLIRNHVGIGRATARCRFSLTSAFERQVSSFAKDVETLELNDPCRNRANLVGCNLLHSAATAAVDAWRILAAPTVVLHPFAFASARRCFSRLVSTRCCSNNLAMSSMNVN